MTIFKHINSEIKYITALASQTVLHCTCTDNNIQESKWKRNNLKAPNEEACSFILLCDMYKYILNS